MTTLAPRPVRRTEPRRVGVGAAQAAHASDYTALAREIKASGLLDRRPIWYAIRCAILVGLFAVGFVLLFTLGHTWWQLAVAAFFGIMLTQASFLTHDSAHRQMFESGKRGEWFSRVVANAVVGLSYGWWMNKHTRHHANPNTIGKDGDIAPGAIVFVSEDARARTGFAGWLTARQGWFFFPILLLAGLDLHLSAIKAIFGGEALKHRAVEGTMIIARLVGFTALVIVVLGPVLGIAFMLVQFFVFGFYMGGTFAPNHTGMPLIGERERVDYLRRQVLTSRNISGGWGIEKLMGGLNYQVEHHLFPSMPSVNLRRARPMVRAYCLEVGVDYTETSLPTALHRVIQHIHRVGLGAADPFACPAAAAFRTA